MKRINDLLWFIPAVLFSVYFLGLQWNNRPTFEENVFICNILDHGISKTVKDFYLTWCGRWSGGILAGLVLGLAAFVQNSWSVIFFAFFLNYLFLIFSIYYFLKIFFSEFLGTPEATIKLISAAVLLFCGFYFGSLQIIENWFWIGTALNNIPIIACLFLGFAILLSKNYSAGMLIVLSFSFAFISGGNEIFSLPVYAVISAILCFGIKKAGFRILDPENQVRKKKFILTWTILTLGITLNLVSPGNVTRYKSEQRYFKQNEISPMHFVEGKNIFQAIMSKTSKEWPMFLMPFIFLGLSSAGKGKNGNISPKKIFGFLCAAILVFIVILVILTEVAFGNLGPYRSWLPVTCLISLTCFFLAFFSGRTYFQFFQKYRFIEPVVLIALIIYFTLRMASHFPVAAKYSVAFDKRVENLRELEAKGEKGVVEVMPLPEPELFVSGEITEYGWKKINRQYARSVGVSFEVQIPSSEKAR